VHARYPFRLGKHRGALSSTVIVHGARHAHPGDRVVVDCEPSGTRDALPVALWPSWRWHVHCWRAGMNSVRLALAGDLFSTTRKARRFLHSAPRRDQGGPGSPVQSRCHCLSGSLNRLERICPAVVLGTFFMWMLAQSISACTPAKSSTSSVPDGLRARAAFDLQCSETAISAHEIGGGSSVLTGCGREAVFVEQCAACAYTTDGEQKNYPCQCTYTRNGDVRARTIPIPSN
jgi:hypothetical protein